MLNQLATQWLSLSTDIAVKSAIVLLAAGLAVMATRRASAAVRHLVLLTGMIGLLGLPLLMAGLPHWNVPIAGRAAPMVTERPSSVVNLPPTPSFVRRVSKKNPTGFDKAMGDTLLVPLTKGDSEPKRAEGSSSLSQAHPGGMGVPPVLETAMPSFAVCLFLVWLAGVIIFGFRMALSFLSLVIVAKGSRPLSGGLADSLSSLANGRVVFRTSDLAGVPMTWGIVRPIILLPAGFEQWPAERVRAVVLHECAHVRRLDWLTQTLTQFTCVLHWCNPFVWLIANRMQIEAEHACDDLVLLAGVAPADYATHLLDIVRTIKSGNRPMPAAIAMAASASTVQPRLAAILEGGRSRRRTTVRGVVLAGVLAAVVLVPIAALRLTAAGRISPMSASQKGIVSVPNSGQRVTLASGVTVEMLGITSSIMGTNEEGWWDASGTPVADPKIHGRGFHNAWWGMSPSNPTRWIAFRLSTNHAIHGDTVGYIVDSTGEFAHFKDFNGRDRRMQDADVTPETPLYGKVNLAFPSNRRAFTYRFGIATGPWTTVSTSRLVGRLHSAPGSEQYRELVKTGGIRISLTDTPEIAYWDSNGKGIRLPLMTASTNLGDVARRLVAVDSRGQEIRLATDIAKLRDGNPFYKISEPDLARIFELRVQTRPYEWAEFKDIAFNPAGVPIASDIPTPAALPPFRQSLPNGVTVDLVAVKQPHAEGGHWWQPDGTLLSGPIKDYKWMVGETGGAPPGVSREFFLQIHTPGPQEVVMAHQLVGDLGGDINNSGEISDGYEATLSELRPSGTAVRGYYPAGTRICTLRYGVSTERWKTLASLPMPVSSAFVRLDNTKGGVGNWTNVYVTVTDRLPKAIADAQGFASVKRLMDAWRNLDGNQAIRLVAVGPHGGLVPFRVGKMRIGDSMVVNGKQTPIQFHVDMSTFTAYGYDSSAVLHANRKMTGPPQIKEFRLQTRPYQWAEFGNIALNPHS